MLVVLYWHFPSLSFLQGVKLIWLMLGNSSVFLPLLGNASYFFPPGRQGGGGNQAAGSLS